MDIIFNSENEIVDYLENYGYDKVRPGLERTRELLKRLSDPQSGLEFIHVAGTNGKGSVCAMLYTILLRAGYRVGFYPSPYLVDFKERIQANGHNIGSDDLVSIGNKVVKECEKMQDHPTYFEMVTAIGMMYFVREKCDIVILETGMGGRLDSTNVIEAPIMSIITNIGLDHTEHLGPTIEKIAAEKAGIIKKGSPVVSYDNVESVRNVLNEVAKSLGCDIFYPEDGKLKSVGYSIENESQTFRYQDKIYELSLLGTNQLKNAEVTLKAVEVLRKLGYKISEEALLRGLKETKWPARFQIISHKPLRILDGGHNEQCAKALIRNLNGYFKDKKAAFVMGMLRDKDYEKVVDVLIPYAERFLLVTPKSKRALEGAELARTISQKCAIKATACSDLNEAMKLSEDSDITVCFGSLYLAGEVLRWRMPKTS